MATDAAAPPRERPRGLERLLNLFSDVREGEGPTVVLLFSNLLLLLTAYYIIKTVRDTLIITSGGATVQSYSAAGQALVLMGFIPLYSSFAGRVDRMKLIFGLMGFFIVNLELFALAFAAGLPYVTVAFFIWVGIYNMATVAQFWSFANDLYRRDTGERLFPVIAIGATLGSPLGAKLAEVLFRSGVDPVAMLQIAVGLVAAHLALYAVVQRRESRRPVQARLAQAPLAPGQGFALVSRSPYVALIAALVIVLNFVNTNGNFILYSAVERAANSAAAADPSFDRVAFVGAFLGGFSFYQNVLAVVIQAFLVSRIVKYLGMAGVLLALPLVAFGAYGLIAAGAGLGLIRLAKITENATDYSVMNTGRQMLWLPTRREEKYQAKQAVDTFFVRTGDVLSAGLVFAGATWLGLQASGFALVNLALVLGWLVLAVALVRRHRRLSADSAAARHA